MDESTLRPRMRSRGTLPAIASVTVMGPYDVASTSSVTSPGESASHKRIFVCAEETENCARLILTNLVHRAYRRPATDADLAELMPSLPDRPFAKGDFELGIEKALERLLVSPQFLYRIEHQPANATERAASLTERFAWPVSDLELASASFLLFCGAACRTTVFSASRSRANSTTLRSYSRKSGACSPTIAPKPS